MTPLLCISVNLALVYAGVGLERWMNRAELRRKMPKRDNRGRFIKRA